MFQFSKKIPTHHGPPKKPRLLPEKYFALWQSWFQSRGIKTEIYNNLKGTTLWREGTESTEINSRKERGIK